MQVKITKTFQVQEPVAQVWEFLKDPRKVASCVPGAQISEALDERRYAGTITVKAGPVVSDYKGELSIERLDPETYEIELLGKGKDVRPERFPTATEILVGIPGEIAHEHEFGESSFAILVTHAAKHDVPVLEALLRTRIRYIGILGGARRALALNEKLRSLGFADGEIDRLHIPVGLDIGAETAEQIAVAVVAELMMVRSGGSGKSLRLVRGAASESALVTQNQ